jgi:hypothetical protein
MNIEQEMANEQPATKSTRNKKTGRAEKQVIK